HPKPRGPIHAEAGPGMHKRAFLGDPGSVSGRCLQNIGEPFKFLSEREVAVPQLSIARSFGLPVQPLCFFPIPLRIACSRSRHRPILTTTRTTIRTTKAIIASVAQAVQSIPNYLQILCY